MKSVENSNPIRSINCPQCGALLKFKPSTIFLVCDHCDFKTEIQQDIEEIEELDFEQYCLKPYDLVLANKSIIECNNCGSVISINENLKSFKCSFCGSPLIISATAEVRTIQPNYLLPFAIDQAQLKDLFKKWIKSFWFVPSKFKKSVLQFDDLAGVYIPFWTFDIRASTEYRGRRGDFVPSLTRNKNGFTPKIETKWQNEEGTVDLFFDDIIVPASKNISPELESEIEPWDLKNLVKVNDQYLSGFMTEKYNLDLNVGYLNAKKYLEPKITAAIKSKIGGDSQEITRVSTAYKKVEFKHILLPIYTSSYSFKNKKYSFYINGRTGKIIGERPYNLAKLLLVFFGFVLLISSLYFVTYYSE